MCSVAFGAIAYSPSVVEADDRCFPAYTRRRSAGSGRLVRSASRLRRVAMEVLAGIERGIAAARQYGACETLGPRRFRGSEPQIPSGYLLESPDTFLTKMCIVSSASEPMELMLEMESERRIIIAMVDRRAAVRAVAVMTLVWRPSRLR